MGNSKGRWIERDAALLFAVALAVRVAVSVSQMLYGLNGIPGSGLSTWADYYTAYVQWLGFVAKGLLPYRDFTSYKYTPLFIYTLFPFFAAGGAKAASVPIVVSDAATAALVYLIAKPLAGKRMALAAGLVYAFAPFVLYYEDYLWLSSQPMTFFLVLAIYLLNEGKATSSFASLAVSVMFKQQALFALPAYLFLYLRDYKVKGPKGFVAFVGVLVAVSLPFLIAAPMDYIGAVNYLPIAISHSQPAVPAAAAVVNQGVLEPNTVQGCQITTLPKLFTGTICGSVVNLQEFASYLFMGKVNQIATLLEPILFALFLPLLFVARRWRNFPQILSAYSMLACLVLFSDYVEASLAYYFVPVYALMFASIADKRTLVLGVGAAALSVVLPEGPLQVILPLGFLFTLVAVQDASVRPNPPVAGAAASALPD